MKTVVVDLLRENFNAMTNAQLMDCAFDRNVAILSYLNQDFIERPVLFRIETPYGRLSKRHFKNIDFTKPRLIYAIEDYVLGGAQGLLKLAPERDIVTALKQIFGKEGLALIEAGEMRVEGKKPRRVINPVETQTASQNSPFANIIPFSERGLRF